MIPLPVDEVRELVPGRLEAAAWAIEVTGLQVDSRRVEEGDLFVAVGDGADFVKHAFARGAAAVLVPDDAFGALAALAGLVRERSAARFVAITGSMGKTSTKDILAAICGPQRRTVAAERSYNAEIGVPLTIGRVEPDTEVCILELAMRGFGQIAELCAFARPDVGVITNVGPVHLEKVGDLDGVIRAKSELVAALPNGGTAVVPDGFPIDRDDLDVVRVGADVTLDAFDPPLLSLGRSASTPRRSSTSTSPNGGTRNCRCPAVGCWSTTPGTPTRCRCVRRSSTSYRSPPAAARLPFSATWPSSARRDCASTRRSDALPPGSTS
jgi:UDP-N-acetylmuramyl pentapeptide synthase